MCEWLRYITHYPICFFRGHELEGRSIVNTMIPAEYFIKRCKCCGYYMIHGEIGRVMVSRKEAYKFRDEFYEAFPDMRPDTKRGRMNVY